MNDDQLWTLTHTDHPFPVRLQTTQSLARMRSKKSVEAGILKGNVSNDAAYKTGAEVFGEYYLTLFMLGHDVAANPPEIFDLDLMTEYVRIRYEDHLK